MIHFMTGLSIQCVSAEGNNNITMSTFTFPANDSLTAQNTLAGGSLSPPTAPKIEAILKALGLQDRSLIPNTLTLNAASVGKFHAPTGRYMVAIGPGAVMKPGSPQAGGEVTFSQVTTRGTFGSGSGRRLVDDIFPIYSVPARYANPDKVLPQNMAIWAAKEITIPDNTHIIISQQVPIFTMLAGKITFGKNVVISYEQRVLRTPGQPPTPVQAPKGPDEPKSGEIYCSTPGPTGTAGSKGYPAFCFIDRPGTEYEDYCSLCAGMDAPGFELVAYTISANPVDGVPVFPAILLRGQDG